jgi:uncharacterized protein with NAD-binding domain and iron-sulfur cluster
MKIAIIGAGLGGMAAAYDLVQAGHEVDIFEAADYVGGLAPALKIPTGIGRLSATTITGFIGQACLGADR